jgi:uncharacterized membrane protein YdjX (TVP38/TMEM64 family)
VKRKLILVGIVVGSLGLFWHFDILNYLSLDMVKSQKDQWATYLAENALQAVAGFFLLYVLVTALSLPAASLMTVSAGALFGVVQGTVIVSFASTVGATVSFFVARYLLRDFCEKKFGQRMGEINQKFSEGGIYYVLSLRLLPLFPFFMVNILCGLSNVQAWRFFVASQIGMLPATAVYVNAGTQIMKIKSLKEIATPSLILSLSALALLPMLVKYGMEKFSKKLS